MNYFCVFYKQNELKLVQIISLKVIAFIKIIQKLFIMTKKLKFLFIAAMGASSVFAGGLLTNTNQSVHFLRNPALDATTEIDGVYYNPAGLVFLSDGFHISLSNQSAFQTRTITSTFAPFAGNGGQATKEYGAKTTALAIPSIQAAYKMNRFAISGSFGVVGGGGVAAFDAGLPSLEAPVSMIPLSLTSNGINTNSYSLDQYMEGKQYAFGVQLNGSYKISDHLSAGVGVRLNLLSNAYSGHLTNIMINPNQPAFGAAYNGSSLVLASKFFTDAAATLNTWSAGAGSYASGLQPIVAGGGGAVLLSNGTAAGLSAAQVAQIQGLLGAAGLTPTQIGGINIATAQGTLSASAPVFAGKATAMTANAAGTADKQLDTKQSGMGFAPIFSLNYNMDRLNVAVKYEMKSTIMLTNETTIDNTGLYPDGAETPNDIPAYLSAGAEFNITDSWKVSGGYHHFFDSDAKMANDKQNYIDGGVNEYLAGTEYKLNKMFLVSAGFQLNTTAVTDDYQTDLSFSLNTFSVGLGGAIDVTPKLRVNLAYFLTNYSEWTKTTANYSNTTPSTSSALPISGTDIYARTSNVFGIGLEYKF